MSALRLLARVLLLVVVYMVVAVAAQVGPVGIAAVGLVVATVIGVGTVSASRRIGSAA